MGKSISVSPNIPPEAIVGSQRKSGACEGI